MHDTFGRDDWIIAGNHYSEYHKYRESLYCYETNTSSYDNGKIIRYVNPADIEGIRGFSNDDLKNPDIFWGRDQGKTMESFLEIASHIPEVRQLLDEGALLGDLINDPILGQCAEIYFDTNSTHFTTVFEADGFYEFFGNGRHRILAARYYGYEIPVKVAGKIVKNNYTAIKHELNRLNISCNNVQQYEGDRKEYEIFTGLGGGDKTKGSCSSLAFAFAGNKGGYDVLDFRGGESQKFFSLNDNIEMISNLSGVSSSVVRGTNDIVCANELLRKMVPEKEYYFATGLHASVVRNHNGRIEYLELQSSRTNGWHLLTDAVLCSRFRCSETNKEELPNFLIDVESLYRSNEFIDILGYINTKSSRQKKGESGFAR